PPGHQRPQDPAQEQQAEGGGRAGEHDGHGIADPAPPVQGGAHRPPSLRASEFSINRAIARTTKVTRNSTKPSGHSAVRCVSVASAKSFAISAAMVVPGSSSEAVKRVELPITKATAMVSPSARPRPRKMPPITAERVYGSTMSQLTSHLVEPSAY